VGGLPQAIGTNDELAFAALNSFVDVRAFVPLIAFDGLGVEHDCARARLPRPAVSRRRKL